MKTFNKTIICIILIGLMSFLGCSKLKLNIFGDKPERLADELIADGMENYRKGDYKEALDDFQKLIDLYPFDKYAILAELKEADSYYKLGKYEDAVFAYEEFENLHPKNEAIPYVVYQQGLCYFEQIGTSDREQSSAYKAIDILERVRTDYYDTEYGAKAEKLIIQCLKSIAEHELYVGEFYFKSKNYEAALSRFKSVVTQFPDMGTHHTALKYITECENIIKDKKEQE